MPVRLEPTAPQSQVKPSTTGMAMLPFFWLESGFAHQDVFEQERFKPICSDTEIS